MNGRAIDVLQHQAVNTTRGPGIKVPETPELVRRLGAFAVFPAAAELDHEALLKIQDCTDGPLEGTFDVAAGIQTGTGRRFDNDIAAFVEGWDVDICLPAADDLLSVILLGL